MSDVEETLKSVQPKEENEIENIHAEPNVNSEGNDDISSNNNSLPENDQIPDKEEDSPLADENDSLDNKPDLPQPEPAEADFSEQPEPAVKKTFFKASTRIIFSRIIYYLFITIFIFNVAFPDFLRFYGSLLLVGICLYLNKFLKRIDKFNYVVQGYLNLTASVFDMGVTVFIMYLSGSSRNLFMLSFPALTWVYGFYGFNSGVIAIFLFNTILFYITGITFGRSDITNLNIELGFYSQLFVLTWIISIHAFTKWFRSQSDLRYEVVKMIEKLFSKLPKSVFQQIASLMNSEELNGLKYKFKKAIEHLQLQIIERDQEIEFLKENGGGGEGGGMQDNFAVNEINSLLDIENLSLKENNKKLMELNKSLEQRVQMLAQELEIANSELERVYSSINDDEEEPQPAEQE